MFKAGTICIFSEDTDLLYEQAARLQDKGYLVFATSNVYKFVKYTWELQPELLVIDVDASALNDRRVQAYLRRYHTLYRRPILMVGRRFDRCYHGIAHYLQKPYSLAMFDEIVESYCGGHKQHDVLLIDECDSRDERIKDEINRQHLSFFEVSDAEAARYYLMKNHPKCVCLNMPYDKCAAMEDKFPHEKIFFVENYKQVKNLAGLI